mmetsp:Transcript_10924/g.32605  ORF Transcript_10924/g.32605 Transcript_10924/m.32605 type:complete len:265 (+) Transcript_10924:191-985(+)
MLRKLLLAAATATTARAKLTPNWKVVADSLGVTTRARVDPETQWCAVHGEAVVDASIAELMTVFGDMRHYPHWDDTLAEWREWTDDAGASMVYQKFKQPWPVRDRELVLQRTELRDEGRGVAVHYASVDDGSPVAKGAVRTQAQSVWWNFTAVSETETLISHYSCVDPGGAIPGWARDLAVQRWCQSQILALVATVRRLGLEPVAEFVGWGAPRAVELLELVDRQRPAPAPHPVDGDFSFEPGVPHKTADATPPQPQAAATSPA